MKTINGISKNSLAVLGRVSRQICLALLLLTACLVLTGCLTPSREEINATIWNNNFPLPADICSREPDLHQRGFFRRLDSGKLEFMSVCKACTPEQKDCAQFWKSVHANDLDALMDKYIPKQNDQ